MVLSLGHCPPTFRRRVIVDNDKAQGNFAYDFLRIENEGKKQKTVGNYSFRVNCPVISSN